MFSFESPDEEPLTFSPVPATRWPPVRGLTVCGPWPVHPEYCYRRPHPLRQKLDAAFSEENIAPPRDVADCVFIIAMLHLVRSSGAVGLLPYAVVSDRLKAGSLA